MIKNGCAFGQVSREMIVETRKSINRIEDTLNEIRQEQKELFNHQSTRLPFWATAFITFLASLVSALCVWTLTH